MHGRAYAQLTIKTIDAPQRVITGTATTPTPDRMDDIVEPLGVHFKNPMPLLLYHDSKRPVGQVKFKPPTVDGIDFEAKLAQVIEPGTLKDRVDEAWHSITSSPPVLRGVSIGFKPIEYAFIKDTGGIRYIKSEVLELSLVAIPANQDAQIATIKSFDRHAPALTGTAAPIAVTAGGSAPRPTGTVMKTYSEQIAELQASRKPKADRMAQLMDGAAEAGRFLNETEQTEYDGLAGEVRGMNGHIERLGLLEDTQRQAATPMIHRTPEGGIVTTRGGVPEVIVRDREPQLEKGAGFGRLVICLAAARGNPVSALEIAKMRYPGMPALQTILKANIAGGTTYDDTWAGPLVAAQNLVGEFIEWLRPRTILGRFGQGNVPSLRRVPFNVRITGQTSGGAGYWVGEAQPKPLTRFDFNAINLAWAKVAAIAVISEDLIRFSQPNAEVIVRDQLGEALMERLDRDFIDPAKAAVALVSPASITNGISPLISSGSDYLAVLSDVQEIYENFITAGIGIGGVVWIMAESTALRVGMLRNPLGQAVFEGIGAEGGTFAGRPVITTQYAQMTSPTDNLLIAVSAPDIFLSDDGGITVDASREASLEMEDSPSNAAGSPMTEATLVSMWQTNSVALRAERYINWARRRAKAVAYMADVKWGLGSPA